MKHNQNIKHLLSSICSDFVEYKNIKFFRHPLYQDYFFNHNNIKCVVKQYSDDIWKEIPVNIHKKEGKEILTITSKYHTHPGRMGVHSRLILETRGLPDKNVVCSHKNDLVTDNNINNLMWMTQKENMCLSGINHEICKNIYILSKNKDMFPENWDNIETKNIIFYKDKKYIKIPSNDFIQNGLICLDGTHILDEDYNEKYPRRDHKGYFSYRVSRASQVIRMHQLMAWAKYYFFPSTKELQVLHINDLSTDNRYENIIIGTHRENMGMRTFNYNVYKELRIIYSENKEIIKKALDMLSIKHKEFLISHNISF
jgi:hypothetical protein